jgi:hypothetical protein
MSYTEDENVSALDDLLAVWKKEAAEGCLLCELEESLANEDDE